MIRDLLRDLEHRGVRLTVNDGKLRFQAPAGAMTDSLKTRVKAHKTEIMEALQTPEPAQTNDPAPLSGAQRRIWVLSQMDPNGSIYNVPLAFHLDGPLQRIALEQAFTDLIQRHETLRTGICMVDGEPRQKIHPQPDFRIRFLDWRGKTEQELRELEVNEEQEPFDLQQPPLMRVILVRLEPMRHMLFVSLHHIISDGWSISILMRDLAAFYRIHNGESDSPPQPLPIQYRHFACSEERYLGNRTRVRKYWLEKLADPLPVLDLPRDNPRPAMQTFNGAEYRFDLKGDRARGFHELARVHRTGSFITFLALIQVLLFRFTGERDLIVGTPIGGRPHIHLEDLIGCFLNTLALRTLLDPRETFAETLIRVRRTATEAYDHQAMPFEQLVRELALDRNLSRSPLFDVMIVSQTDRHLEARMGEMQVRPCMKPAGISKFDMTFHITDNSETVGIAVEYNSDLFHGDRIARMAQSFLTLLDSVLAHPQRTIGDHAILPSSERRNLLLQGPSDSSEARTLLHFIRDQVALTPDRTAVRVARCRETGSPEQKSFRELWEDAGRVAARLTAMGVGPGTLVGFCVDRGINMVAGLLGIMRTGAAYVPMDPKFPRDRLVYMLEHSGVSIILAQPNLLQAPPSCHVLDPDLLVGEESGNGPVALPHPQQTAYVIYTSGSTGKPKGVTVPHGALANFLLSMQGKPGLSSSDSLLAVTSLSFDISGLELFLPLITGARLLIADHEMTLDGKRLAAAIQREAVTVMQATPITWRLLLTAGNKPFKGLKVLCGGEALPGDLARTLKAHAAGVWNLYGPTETTIWSACHRVDAGDGIHEATPIGEPIEGTRIYILDQRLHPVPEGAVGELYIGGSGVATGYLNRPDLSADRFLPDPFAAGGQRMYRTGDRARLIRNSGGRLQLMFLGRNDGQIKLRGFRIETGEIEAAMQDIQSVRQAVVLLHGPKENQRLIAFSETTEPIEIDALRTRLAARLPEYMIPSDFLFIETWPLTPNGKINRKALADRGGEQITHRPDAIPPKTPTERLIAEIWADVLGRDGVNANDRFFEIGGHSLTAAQVVFELARAQQAPIALVDLFREPTLSHLAALLDNRSNQPAPTNSALQAIGRNTQQIQTDPDRAPLLEAQDLESLYEP